MAPSGTVSHEFDGYPIDTALKCGRGLRYLFTFARRENPVLKVM